MGFTQVDNCWLDGPGIIGNAEFRVIMILERLLTGYHRRKYKIAYSKISEMTGVKNVYKIMKSLNEKGHVSFKSESGRASEIQIHKPSKLVSRSSNKASNSVSNTIEVNDTHHSNDLYDHRRSKDNSKENFKESSTLTIADCLIEEMKSKYPDKDIGQATTSFLNYPHLQGKMWSAAAMAISFKKWCASEKPSHKKFIAQFKEDTTGFPMAYCEKCGISASYEEKELKGDSRCHNSKLLPTKPKTVTNNS